MLRRAWVGVICLTVAACSSDEGSGATGGGGSSGGGGSGGTQASDAGTDALDCDPHNSPASGGGGGGGNAGGTEAGTIVLDGGNIDLEGGSGPPAGYLKCYDPSTGAGFLCETYGKVCCEKKDDCWDPAEDPTFCDRPWCPID
jgi:hypothetical protein